MTGGGGAPVAEVAHRVPGRIRLRVAAKRGDAAYFERLAAMLAALSGVERVEANPLTGSVLVRGVAFDPDQLLDAAERAGLLEASGAMPSPSTRVGKATFARQTGELLQEIGNEVAGATNGYVDGRSLLQLAYFAMSVWQVRQGHVLAAATSLIWHAGELGMAALGKSSDDEGGEDGDDA